ncbi:MAG TPA: SRPBCC domain-containing protein [Sediminibacterium sp.]|nr:SRPBCC domain-containing protein [Sediminibacterium sp.]
MTEMELKTKVTAEPGRQEIFITREFNLPVALLFKAHIESEFLEQWMSNKFSTMKVLKLEPRQQGSWHYVSTDTQGNTVFEAYGVIHRLETDQQLIRTFEMARTPFGVQLEIYRFTSLTEQTSQLRIQTIYESVQQRDQLLQLPFAQGLNLAHNRLQEICLPEKP